MRTIPIARVASLVVAGSFVVTLAGLTFNAVEACGEAGNCTQYREMEFSNLLTWQACDPSLQGSDFFAQCDAVAGNTKDCTGVLSCGLIPINPKYRTEAEHAVLISGEKTQGCYLCAIPNCVSGQYSFCEPTSRRCELYANNPYAADAGSDGGGTAPSPGPGGTADAGTPGPSDAGGAG